MGLLKKLIEGAIPLVTLDASLVMDRNDINGFHFNEATIVDAGEVNGDDFIYHHRVIPGHYAYIVFREPMHHAVFNIVLEKYVGSAAKIFLVKLPALFVR